MIRKVYTWTATVIFTVGLLVVGLEVGTGRVLARLSDQLVTQTERSPYYADRPWAKTYHEEFTRITRAIKYHPYTIWRFPAQFRGQHINTDQEGLRVTPGSASLLIECGCSVVPRCGDSARVTTARSQHTSRS